MATPPSQKLRRIGLWLEGGAIPIPVRFDFAIRPEDLTHNEGSRLQVSQTIGGAWVDAFGRSLSTINISGHQGWRGSYLLSGEDLFHELRATVFEDWHARRKTAAERGSDPSSVRLSFVDTLDGIRAEVVPKTFTLRRSRTSPLLMRYQISLVVVDDTADSILSRVDEIVGALSNPLRYIAGITGLRTILGQVDGYMRMATTALSAARVGIQQLGGIAVTLTTALSDIAAETRGAIDALSAPLFGTTLAVTSALRNSLYSLASSTDLTVNARGDLMRAAALWADVYCTASNSFAVGRYFRSFEELFGASLCSSTAGGRSWSTYAERGISPFSDLFLPDSSAPSRVAVSLESQAALSSLRGDPMRLVGREAEIGDLALTAASGITVQ